MGGEHVNNTFNTLLTNYVVHIHLSEMALLNAISRILSRQFAHILDANMLYFLGFDALPTIMYFINHLLSHTTNDFSLYHLLYKTSSQYDHLRTFGCQCFSWHHPYSPNKLMPKSISYIFINYAFFTEAINAVIQPLA